MAGRPRKFDDNSIIEMFRAFCDEIKTYGFLEIPSQTNFCRWLSRTYSDTDRKTIYNYLNKYFPTIKEEFERIQSDTVAEGAMLGRYNATMSIFVLKNWCSWGDKQEITADITSSTQVTASSKLLKALLDDNTQRKE